MYPNVQDTLREEIQRAQADTRETGEVNPVLGYETIMALPFLDAVCKETLRVYAPTPFRHRR